MYNDISKNNKPSRLGKFVSNTWKWIKITAPLTISVVVIAVFVFCVNSVVKVADENKYPHGNYEMVYRVYYDVNTIKEYTIRHDRPMWQGSHQGTNYIMKYPDTYVIKTNAPIEVVKYVDHNK